MNTTNCTAPEYNAVMVDLEALSTESNAAIISIGAVKFWLNVKQTEFTEDQLFYTAIKASSSQEAGLHVSAETCMWWMDQGPEARSAFKNPVSLASALGAFSRFVPNKETYIFGYGAAYDNVVLHHAYNALNIKYPVSYKFDVCARTLDLLSNEPKIPFEGTKHHALSDAINQTKRLMNTLEKYPWKS